MKEYQTRVVKECQELEEKLISLYAFLASKQFEAIPSAEDRDLLKMQYYSMKVYSGILLHRIARFN